MGACVCQGKSAEERAGLDVSGEDTATAVEREEHMVDVDAEQNGRENAGERGDYGMEVDGEVDMEVDMELDDDVQVDQQEKEGQQQQEEDEIVPVQQPVHDVEFPTTDDHNEDHIHQHTQQSDDVSALPVQGNLSQPQENQQDQAGTVDDHNHTSSLEGNDLFALLLANPEGVIGLVSSWHDHVKNTGAHAVADLLSLIVAMARPLEQHAKQMITSEMVTNDDPKNSVKEIEQVMKEDLMGKVMGLGKDSKSRKVRRAFEDFWKRLVADGPKDVVFGMDCVDTIVYWLEAMCQSKSRSLRTVTCLAAFRMFDGLLDHCAKLKRDIVPLRKQLAMEEKRCALQSPALKIRNQTTCVRNERQIARLSDVGKNLLQNVEELVQCYSDLEEISDKIFDLVFIRKYRDVSPDIRCIAMSSLASWMQSRPDRFLTDTYTKYIGWLLSDKESSVRKCTLDNLSKICRRKSNLQKLSLFLQNFKGRIVQMSRDKGDVVAISAIRLMILLNSMDFMDASSCQGLCDIAMSESHKEVRRAAGDFVASMLCENTYATTGKERPKPGKVRKRPRTQTTGENDEIVNQMLSEIPPLRTSTDQIKNLLFLVLRDEDNPGDPDLIVDAVWDFMPALRCWEAFIELLRHNSNASAGTSSRTKLSSRRGFVEQELVSESDRAILCEMVLSSVKEACGHGDVDRKSIVEQGERDSTDPPAIFFSKSFLPCLSEILPLFETNKRALMALVQLPVYFREESFEQSENERNFMQALMAILGIMSRHTASRDLVEMCSGTFKELLTDHSPLRHVAVDALKQVYFTVARELNTLVCGDISAAEPLAVSSAIVKVRALSQLIEPPTALYESVINVLKHQIDKGPLSDLDDEVTNDAARTGCAIIMWLLCKVKSLLEECGDETDQVDGPILSELTRLHDQGGQIVEHLRRVCSSTAFPVSVRIVALQTLLTTITSCQGVERFAGSLSVAIPKFGSNSDTEGNTVELIELQGQVESLQSAVTSCTLAVLEHELKQKDHSGQRGSGGKRKRKLIPIPEEAIIDCFASLVQASRLSVLGGKVSHLPFLGLLLGDKSLGKTNPVTGIWTAKKICKRYSMGLGISTEERTRIEVQCILDMTRIADWKKDQHPRELCEQLLSLRRSENQIRDTSSCLLEGLVRISSDDTFGGLQPQDFVDVVGLCGFSLVAKLTENVAKRLLVTANTLQEKLDNNSSENEKLDLEVYSQFVQCLKAVSENVAPDIPRKSRRWIQVAEKPYKRKRKLIMSATPRIQPSESSGGNIRRSNRSLHRPDYAKMLDSESEEVDGDSESPGGIEDFASHDVRVSEPGPRSKNSRPTPPQSKRGSRKSSESQGSSRSKEAGNTGEPGKTTLKVTQDNANRRITRSQSRTVSSASREASERDMPINGQAESTGPNSQGSREKKGRQEVGEDPFVLIVKTPSRAGPSASKDVSKRGTPNNGQTGSSGPSSQGSRRKKGGKGVVSEEQSVVIEKRPLKAVGLASSATGKRRRSARVAEIEESSPKSGQTGVNSGKVTVKRKRRRRW